MKRAPILLLVLVMVLGFSLTAYADLILRGTDDIDGYQLIYDTDLDVTFYDFTNPLDYWDDQVAWADALTVTFGGTTFSDWRLPTALNQDGTGPCGTAHDCTDSELGHLYYTELGNVAGGPFSTGFTDALTGQSESFLNLGNDEPYIYWTGTEVVSLADHAWTFDFYDGFQGWEWEIHLDYALAVRPGDVSAVPEPGTMLLLGMGMTGMVLVRKRLGRIHR